MCLPSLYVVKPALEGLYDGYLHLTTDPSLTENALLWIETFITSRMLNKANVYCWTARKIVSSGKRDEMTSPWCRASLSISMVRGFLMQAKPWMCQSRKLSPMLPRSSSVSPRQDPQKEGSFTWWQTGNSYAIPKPAKAISSILIVSSKGKIYRPSPFRQKWEMERYILLQPSLPWAKGVILPE